MEIKQLNNEKPTGWRLVWQILFVVFMVSNLFLQKHPDRTWTNIYRDKPYRIVIIVFLIFYAITTIWDIIKFYKKEETPQTALLLNEKGITDFLTFKDLGVIAWEDIKFIGVKNNFLSPNLLIVKVKNPLDYINRAGTNFKLKKQLRENNAKHQTPIVIYTNLLDIPTNKLHGLVKNEWRRYKINLGQ